MEKNKPLGVILIIATLLVGAYFIFFNNKKVAKDEQPTEQKKISNADRITKELADKYQALVADKEDITYTLQAQEKFITGKPTLFTYAYVDDIFKRDGKTFVSFSSSWLFDNDYTLELECNKEIVDKILGQTGGNNFIDFDGEYAVVANIQEVSKPAIALKGSALSEDEVDIDIESSGYFTAKGICIDVVYIPNENTNELLRKYFPKD